jgi:hypothetical protein
MRICEHSRRKNPFISIISIIPIISIMAESSRSISTVQLDKSLIDTVERSFPDPTVSQRVLSLISQLAEHFHELSPAERELAAAATKNQLTTPPEHEITVDAFLGEWDETPQEDRLSLCEKWWNWTIGPDWSLYQRWFESALSRQDEDGGHTALIQVLEWYLKPRVPYKKRPHVWQGLASHWRFRNDSGLVGRFTLKQRV